MQAENLNLNFGAIPIYHDASFKLESRDKVGIVGVNGAGKSTLFKVILGIEKLDDGTISIPALRIGFLPQEIKIEPEHENITVWEYIYSARPVDELQEKLNQEYEKLAKYPESKAILERINAIQDDIDACDVGNMDQELLKIVERMNLQPIMDKRMVDLSGGQKSKVAFARVLFENAGLLLLDEPTNHLDVETKKFVSNYLRNYRGMVLVISHDAEFLDVVTSKTLFLNKVTHKTKVYKGNYSEFRKQRANELAEQEKRITEQEKEIKRMEEFVMRTKAAKRSNTAFIRQGQIREKQLEKKYEELEVREREYQKVQLNISPSKLSGKTPLEVQNLSFAYPGGPKLHDGLSFSLTRGEKFLVVGENGTGKSTLLKLIVGQLTPDEGSIIMSQNTSVAYYAQEFEILNEKETILDNVKSYDFTETETRSMLANFLFHDEEVFKRVSVLSPGEKARVALCKILMKKANLIILDEPTNHFDPETQKIIGSNFHDYDGTILMVSHNPSFVDQIGISRMLILPNRDAKEPRLALIKNYNSELLDYYYYLNSELI